MAYSKLIIPTAFLYGLEAKQAVRDGLAVQIAGGLVAFGLSKIISRHSSEFYFLTAAQLLNSDDDDIKLQLVNIAKPRQNFSGLDMAHAHVMGIMNLTPDSFSDGGNQQDLTQVERKIDAYIAQGLSIVDVGGESTRPNAKYVSCQQEIDRVAPILNILKTKNVQVSIDTRKANVMEYALAHGADIINDVSALEFKANVAQHGEQSGDSEALVVEKKCPVVLMHSQGTPEVMQIRPTYDNILFDIYDYLQSRISFLTENGLALSQLSIDPGIGFGKTVDHCLIILKNVSLFHSLGVPILMGASRKSFIGHINAQPDATKRIAGSLATANLMLNAGVQMHRVHDIEESIQQNNIINSIHAII